MGRLVAVSGGYDPLHHGHIRQFQQAASLGDALIVFLNSDAWLNRKKGRHWLTWEARREVLQSLRWVTAVLPVDDADGTVASAIYLYRPNLFAKGGDRVAPIPAEARACRAVGCQMVFGMGSKVASSSDYHA